MARTFRKAILKCDTYQSGDGQVVVTPDRLRHWESQFRRLSANRYAVPMHWNHAELDDPELLQPISENEYQLRETRGAQNTVGKMTDFRVTDDGQAAEIVVEVLTPSAQEKVGSNAVFVSPVIFPEFADGAGQTYADVITSVDLVDYPVDHSQGPFVSAEPAPTTMSCVIRMGIRPTYYKGIQRMAADNAGYANDQDADNMDQSMGDSMGGGDLVSQIVAAMAEMGIQLPEGTDETNIVENLKQVLGNGGQGQATDSNPMGTTVASPDIQTMSLAAQTKRHRNYAETIYHRELAGQLTQLRDQGKITDDEHRQYTAMVATQRLSLDQYSKPKTGKVEYFIETRRVLPANTFRTATNRSGGSTLRRMSVAPLPEHPSLMKDKDLPQERIDAAVKLVNG